MISYFIRRGGNEDGNCDYILEAGNNLFTGEADFVEVFGQPTSLEADLLLMSASVFAADRATARGECEDIARRIELHIPVVNTIRLLSLTQQIEKILRFLSNDAWRITLRQEPGESETKTEPADGNGRTLLFSGGLDSFAAAIEFGKQNKKLQLVSHRTRNQNIARAQQKLAAVLCDGGLNLPYYQFFVSSRDKGPSQLQHAQENTQRTRSFLFLILGALAARRAGHSEIVYLAENGPMAINLPLTHGRIGAFSTHTAHPDFLVAMEAFLSKALNMPLKISNPYVHLTKAEVVKKIVNSFPDTIPITRSCWRDARLPESVTHCGECIPCFIRRISIEYLMPDPTNYGRDVWSEEIGKLNPDDTGRRGTVELAEFVQQIERYSSEEIMSEWPELYSSNINPNKVIEMYKRFSQEARAVISRYPALESLLS